MEAAEGGAPPPSPPRPPQIGEGQDVLARWTDGLLYLGVVKKVDAARRGCLIQFEDNSQFFVLWKDISPAAVPGDDPACCVCAGSARNAENSLVRCGKCGHVYHQRCHAPPAPGGAAPWSCRRCVFAVATKHGGALRRGPQARAMLRMKSVLPYALGALDWDPPHLHNLQHCYCYCGGPGHWNLKMLQCRRCQQWFHEACTQCLTRPLLYGDRFYIFECSVCRGGAESVRRLPLRWVDVAHLLLYHLSVCCKRKYFDLEREILPFANSNWDALRLGQLSATPRSQRYGRLLGALSTHKDRFVSGREMKKRRGLFGLHSRAPPPLPPALTQRAPPGPAPGPAHRDRPETGPAHRDRPETGPAHRDRPETGPAHRESPKTGPAHRDRPAPRERPETGPAPRDGPDPAPSPAPRDRPEPGPALRDGPDPAPRPRPAPRDRPEPGPAPRDRLGPAPRTSPGPAPRDRPAPSRGGTSLSEGRGQGGARRRPSPRGSQAPPSGSSGVRKGRARAAPSPPIRMFASFHPSQSPSSPRPDPEPEAPPPSQAPPPVQAPPPRVLARRVTLDGTVQYLLEWGGGAGL